MLDVMKLLEEYQITPRREAGQNFLIDRGVLEEIVATADLKKTDNVLEVGPGLGVLTNELVTRAKRVVAVELDRTLFTILKKTFRDIRNLQLVREDILEIGPPAIKKMLDDQSYKVVANIPYNITSNLIRQFLESPARPTKMVLLVQKEVGERIIAEPGQASLLSIAVQLYSVPRIVRVVPADCFYPAPAVDSVILDLKVKPELPEIDEKRFFRLLHIGFSAKRKQLQNNLQNGLRVTREAACELLESVALGVNVRPQELTLDDWIRLLNKLPNL